MQPPCEAIVKHVPLLQISYLLLVALGNIPIKQDTQLGEKEKKHLTTSI